jgi:cyclopropane fatty-acyl-phospholipid synthase-like methyltransferase
MDGKIVLELGCGIGTDGAYFVESGAKYYGIELSNESLRIAQKRFNNFNLVGHFSKTKIEDLNLSQLNWPKPDIVFSFGVLHHTLNPLSALRNISNQVSEGTTFKFMLYAKNSLKSALINQGLDQFEAQENCPVAFTYSQDEARALFQNAGLKVISVEQDHIFSYNIEAYKNYEYKIEPWFLAMPKAYYDALKKELGWHLLITAIKD